MRLVSLCSRYRFRGDAYVAWMVFVVYTVAYLIECLVFVFGGSVLVLV